MMTIAIFLGAVAIGLVFTIPKIASSIPKTASRYPSKDCADWRVSDRFLERGDPYTADQLAAWVKNNDEAAHGYAFPVLFPWDVAFMVFLGGFLGAGSIACATLIPFLKPYAAGATVLPAAYIAADFLEDMLLARLLLRLTVIDDDSVRAAKCASRVKLLTSLAAVLQTIVLAALAIFFQLS